MIAGSPHIWEEGKRKLDLSWTQQRKMKQEKQKSNFRALGWRWESVYGSFSLQMVIS